MFVYVDLYTTQDFIPSLQQNIFLYSLFYSEVFLYRSYTSYFSHRNAEGLISTLLFSS